MSSMKTNISSALVILASMVLCSLPIHAHEKQLTNVSFKYWKQGTTINAAQNSYSLSTVGLEDGYYTTTLANERARDFTGVAGMKIELKVADQEIRVNLIFGSDTAVVFEDGSVMIALDEVTGEIHRSVAAFGTFTVPAYFSGTLYFPFDALKSNIGKIDYWGLTIVQEEDTVVGFTFETVSILDLEDAVEYQTYLQDQFILPTSVQIPVVGESIAILKGPTTGEYRLDSTTQGVTIEKNKMTLTTEAIKGSIDYRFTYDDGRFVRFSTNVVPSWIVGVENQGIPIALPVKSINLIQRFGILVDNSFMHGLRLGIGIIALLFIVFYRFIRSKEGN
ncbi:MAG TPA: hypothetical protein DCP62_06745 [Erysipelotrichaceae bacterium]|nr:MAG: hypothetical protein A2Y19_03280 [Firmicutes bacterium GWE2_51_13]HAM63332.1 hypothetical protein [Erysipelotrichaceae bacterium]HBZ42110.1 hypothetical protein [Erysipelotrichaceae bacterium]